MAKSHMANIIVRSYLGVVRGPSGGGSYFRHGLKDVAARKAVQTFQADFKHVYGTLKKGTKCPVNIYDVTGIDVLVGEDGVWEKDLDRRHGKQVPQLEVVYVTV